MSAIMLVIVWQVVALIEAVPSAVLPGPVTVLVTAAEMAYDGTLGQALAISLGRVLIGSGIGIVLGVVLGLTAGLWRIGNDLIDRPVQMVRTIPFTALTPLLILWFGLGETPKIVLVVVATAVPMYLNTLSGVRGVDPRLVEVAVAYRLSSWRRATRVLLPGALGPTLVGLRHALGVGWIAVIVAETVNSSAGIGYLLTNARTYVRTDVMFVCIAVYAILGLLTDGLVRWAEAHLLQWRSPRSRRSRPDGMAVRRPDLRRLLVLSAVLTTLAMALPACSTAAADASGQGQESRVGLRVGPLTTQNTLTLALASGAFATVIDDAGGQLTASFSFPAFAPAAEAIAAGQIDMTTASSTAFITALQGNPDLAIFAVEHNDNDTQGIVASPGSGIRSVQDLAGHSVAVNQGGTGDYLLRQALAQAGMGIQDVEPVYLGPEDAASAFATGKVDAWATWDQYLAFAQTLDDAALIVDAADIDATNRTVHVVSREFLTAHPEMVRAAFEALDTQATTVAADPQLLADAYRAAGSTPQVADTLAAKTPPTIAPADHAFLTELQGLADFYAQQGLTPTVTDVSEAVVDVGQLP